MKRWTLQRWEAPGNLTEDEIEELRDHINDLTALRYIGNYSEVIDTSNFDIAKKKVEVIEAVKYLTQRKASLKQNNYSSRADTLIKMKRMQKLVDEERVRLRVFFKENARKLDFT